MLLATTFRTVSCAAALLAFGQVAGTTAQAGEATYLAHDANPCAIFRVLSNDLPGECRETAAAPEGMRTRSIKFHAPAQAAAQSAVAAATPVIEAQPLEAPSAPKELSLAMRIQFEYNSDALTDEAKQSLDNVAVVLNNDLMADKVIMVEGHADATGSGAYNLDLSSRRAQAVQFYLMSEHEIEDWRLPFTGKGESEPFDPAQPTASVNRRVEFTNVTG